MYGASGDDVGGEEELLEAEEPEADSERFERLEEQVDGVERWGETGAGVWGGCLPGRL